MKTFLLFIATVASAFAVAVNDIKISQNTSASSPVAYADRFVTPTASSLLGFDSTLRPANITLGANLSMVGNVIVANGGSSIGSVTSVALTAPPFLTVSGSPITTAGTLALALANQGANMVFAGPASGANAPPTFRDLVLSDIPTGIPASNIAVADAGGFFLSTNVEDVLQELGATVAGITNVNPPSSTGNFLIFGAVPGFVSGLTMTVGAGQASFQGEIVNAPITTLTATAADPTNPRIDAVVMNNAGGGIGTYSIIAGTPGATPLKPAVDPTSQLEITFYTIDAAATVLPVTVVDIYHENTEWTMTKVGSTINLASTNNPYRGSVDIEGTAVVAGNSFTGTAPSTFDIGTYGSLIFYIRSKATWPAAKQFSVQLLNGSGNPIGALVTFKSGLYGFNSATTGAYQQVSIPTSVFGASTLASKALRFTAAGGGGSFGFYIDDITLQSGLPQSTTTSGMQDKGAYVATTAYNLHDTVTSGGILYVSIQAGAGHTPASSPTFWLPYTVAGVQTVNGTANEITATPSGGTTTISIPAAVTFTGKTVTGGTYTGATLSGTTTQTGTTILTPYPMPAFAINVNERWNTKTLTDTTPLTFSGTPPTNQWFGAELTNGTAGDLTIPIPTCTLTNANPAGTTSTFLLPASGIVNLAFRYNGSVTEIFTGGSTPAITALTGDVTAAGPGSAAATLANTAVAAGSYTNTSLTVDAKGRLTAASSGTAAPTAANPTATVGPSATNGSAGTFMRSDAAPALANTAVTAGSYTNTNLTVDAQGRLTAASNGSAGVGSVTSVGLSLPSVFTVSNSPVTSSGTLTGVFATGQTANQFLATPDGTTGAVGLRAIVAADVPTLNQNTSGTAANLSGTPALPNGTTATTQSPGDNTTKLATDAFVLANAGASSPLTIKGDVYTFSTVNAKLAVGSNGTIFMADSAATTGNKWSTPTYPNTATSGKVLIGDGSNVVLSTPTFPNASATTRKIIVSDGTNWVASTETYAVPGTLNNVMVSDGTNWTSSGITSNIGAQTIWIPAAAMIPAVTNGCTYLTVTGGGTNPDTQAVEFDPATNQFAEFSIAMPKSWNAGTVTCQFLWSHPATVTNFGVVWGLKAVDVATGGAISTGYGTGQEVTSTGGTTNSLYISSYTSAITIGGTPAATDLVLFNVYRNAASGSDTLAVNARLSGIRLIYTTNSANDN